MHVLELEGLKFTTVASGVTWQHKGSVYLLTWAAAKRLSDWFSVELGKCSDWAPMGFNRYTQVDLSPEALTAAVWSGEGLPPVGCECEALHSPQCGYLPVLTVGHDGNGAVVRWLRGPSKGAYTLASKINGFDLRPLRTAEQLAAEAREKVIAEMVERFALGDRDGVPWRDLFAQMYDAGVRLPDA